MFNFDNNGQEIKVFFKHDPHTVEYGPDVLFKRATTVFMIDLATGKEIATAQAFCSKKDNFSRDTGRKVALAKVLMTAFPNDEVTRVRAWNAYHTKILDSRAKSLKPKAQPAA